MKIHLQLKLLSPAVLLAILLAGCYCRNEDCPESDEILSIRIIDERGVEYDSLGNEIPVGHRPNYADSIEFYSFDDNQQKVAYPIHPSRSYRSSPMSFYVNLSEMEPNAPYRFYINYNGRTSTIDFSTQLLNTRCCGDLLRFHDIKMDGRSVARIELVFE